MVSKDSDEYCGACVRNRLWIFFNVTGRAASTEFRSDTEFVPATVLHFPKYSDCFIEISNPSRRLVYIVFFDMTSFQSCRVTSVPMPPSNFPRTGPDAIIQRSVRRSRRAQLLVNSCRRISLRNFEPRTRDSILCVLKTCPRIMCKGG